MIHITSHATLEHNLVVNDNYYGVRFNSSVPFFQIEDTAIAVENLFANKFNDSDYSPPFNGYHYVVTHTHSHAIMRTDNLNLLYQKVCWDIQVFNQILKSIPFQHLKAIATLAKEITLDNALKSHLENRMWFSWQVTCFPAITSATPLHQVTPPPTYLSEGIPNDPSLLDTIDASITSDLLDYLSEQELIPIHQPATPPSYLRLPSSPYDSIPDDPIILFSSPSDGVPETPPNYNPPVALSPDISIPLAPIFTFDDSMNATSPG